MSVNEGVFDRVVRITAGYLLVSSFFLIDSDWRWLTLLGVLPVLSGLAGRCPAYVPFGISTCARRS